MAPGASSGEFSIRFSTFQFQLWRSKEGGYHLDGKIRQRLRPSVEQRNHNLVPIDCSDRHNGHDKEISIGEGRCRGPLLAPQVARRPKSEIFHSNLLSMENMSLADRERGVLPEQFSSHAKLPQQTQALTNSDLITNSDKNRDKKVSSVLVCT